MAKLDIYKLPIIGQYLFENNDKKRHKSVNRFNKALWSDDERIDDIASSLLRKFEVQYPIRYSKDKQAYLDVLKVYISNVVLATKSKKKYLAVSLNNNSFVCDIKQYEPIKISRTFFKKINQWMYEADYVNFYLSEAKLSSDIQSIIEPLESLTILIDDYDIKFHHIFYHQEYSFVQMVNEDDKLVEFEDDEYSLHRKDILKKYNEYLSKQDITVEGNPISKPVGLKSEYKRANKELYGRINGGEWMQTSKETRLDDIKIDKKDVVEVDLSSSTFRIAADLDGNHISLETDSYYMEGIDRELVKSISTRLQNNGPCTPKQGCSKVTNSILREIFNKKANSISQRDMEW